MLKERKKIVCNTKFVNMAEFRYNPADINRFRNHTGIPIPASHKSAGIEPALLKIMYRITGNFLRKT